MLELLYRGIAPAALILGAVDAIIGLGILVAAEMGFAALPFAAPGGRRSRGPGRKAAVVTIGHDGRLDRV